MKEGEGRASVYIDSEQAKNELNMLEQKAKELRAAITEAGKANNLSDYTKLKKELNGVEKEMKQLKKETFDVQKVLKNLNGTNFRDLQRAQMQITAELKKMERGTVEYVAKSKQMQLVSAEVRKVKTEMTGLNTVSSGGFFGKMAGGFNKYFGMATAALASVTGLTLGVKKAVEAFNDFEKKLDNLSALTGLQGEELEYLSDQAKKLSVSTVDGGVRITQSADAIVDAYTKVGSARPELLKNKEALNQVTQEAIILSEAANGELQPAVDALAMVLNQFNAPATDARRIINALAAGSKEGAGEIPYLTTAIEKAGTVAADVGMNYEQLIGTIETLAPRITAPEIAGRSLKGVILDLQKTADDTNPAIVGFAQAIENLGKKQLSTNELMKIFGSENITVAKILLDNQNETKKYTEAVTGTNVALEQASINTDNNASKLEQARNRAKLVAIELGEKLAPAMTAVTGWGTRMLKIIGGVVDLFVKYKNGIISLTAGIAAYTVVVKAAKYWDDAYYYLLVAKDKAAKIYSVTVGIITGKIKLATVAQQAWNTAKSAGAGLWGILIAAIVAAGVYMVKFSKSMHEEEKVLTDFKNKLSEVVSESNSLFEQLKKTNPGTKERAELIGLINEKYGDYLEGINLEVAGLKQIEDAQQRVNNKLIENLVLEAKQAEVKELAKAQADILLKLGEKGIYLSDLTEGKGALKKYVIWADQEIQLLSDGYFNLEQQIASVGDKYNEVAEGIRKSLTPGSYTNTGPKEGDTKTEDGISYVYKNGAWEIVQNKGGGSGESLKKLEELKNKTADIRRQMYIDTLSDNEKELTIIRDKFDKELLAAGITHDKIMQLRKLDPAKMSAEEKIQWDYYLSINDQQNAEIQAKKAEQLEKLQAQEDDYQSKKDAAREEILKATMSDEDAELKAARDKYINLKELATMFGLDMSKIIELQGAEEEAIKQKYRQKEKDADAALKKTLADNEQKLYDQKVSVISAASNTLGNIMELMGKKSQEDTAFYKALGLAQIAIDTGIAVAAGVRTVMTSKTSVSPWEKIAAVIAIGGEIIGAITSATSILNKADVPTYASGGPTGSGYGSPDESGYKVAGVVHQDEYVIPAWERKIPQVMAMERIIESIRVNRSGYAAGGATQQPASISVMPQVVTYTDAAMIGLLQEIHKELKKPTRAKVVYSDFTDMESKVNDVYDTFGK